MCVCLLKAGAITSHLLVTRSSSSLHKHVQKLWIFVRTNSDIIRCVSDVFGALLADNWASMVTRAPVMKNLGWRRKEVT